MLSFSHVILNPIYTVIIIVYFYFSAQTYYLKSISHHLLDIPAWISEAKSDQNWASSDFSFKAAFSFFLPQFLATLSYLMHRSNPSWGNPWLLTFSSIHHVLSVRKSYQFYANFLSVKHVCPCLGLVLIIVISQLNYCKTAAAKTLNSSFCFASNCYILLTTQYLG